MKYFNETITHKSPFIEMQTLTPESRFGFSDRIETVREEETGTACTKKKNSQL